MHDTVHKPHKYVLKDFVLLMDKSNHKAQTIPTEIEAPFVGHMTVDGQKKRRE